MRVENGTRGTVLAEAAQLATAPGERRRGLRGRARLGPGEGLVLMPSLGTHTFGMRFPVDIVLVDRALRVVRTLEGVHPGRIATFRWSHAAVELPAGTVAASGTVRGDRLAFARNDTSAP